MAKKTFVLIACVGPFSRHGEFAYKACATHGTHYLDATGEAPFTKKMVKKYENVAKSSGAIMIGQAAIESSPSDICTWTLAKTLREELDSSTGKVTIVVDVRYAIPPCHALSKHSFLNP